jgi:hypothetical protein
MSMIPIADDPGLRVPLGRTPEPERFAEGLPGAAMRQANSVVSAISALRNSGPFTPEDGYTALPDIKGTPYFDNHSDRFVASTSRAETDSIKRRIDQEEADKKLICSLRAGLAWSPRWLPAHSTPQCCCPDGWRSARPRRAWRLRAARARSAARWRCSPRHRKPCCTRAKRRGRWARA